MAADRESGSPNQSEDSEVKDKKEEKNWKCRHLV